MPSPGPCGCLGPPSPDRRTSPSSWNRGSAPSCSSLLGSVLSGERVLKGISLFSDRLGEAVAAPGFTLMDDPTEPAAWGASAFDDEGLACRRNVMIEGGVLRRFLYDSTSARRAGTASTASAVRAGYKTCAGRGRPGRATCCPGS